MAQESLAQLSIQAGNGTTASDLWIEAIRVIPDVAWVMVVAWGIWWLYPKIKTDILLRLRTFKGYGIEVQIAEAERQLEEASAKRRITLPFDDRKRLLKRIERVGSVLTDALVLWVDDAPENNRVEHGLLTGLGAKIATVTTSNEALKKLGASAWDVVISDMERDGNKNEGAAFAQLIHTNAYPTPVIIYTGTSQEGRPCPAYVFGITNHPDNLVHLVLDALERRRG